MLRPLTRHPGFNCAAVAVVEAEAWRPAPGLLALRYVLRGVTGDLVIPATSAPSRTDGLWRRTCLEAFVRGPDGEAYWEVNLSPSTQWAAYRFDGYREGMAGAEVAAPRIGTARTADSLELTATLDLDRSGLAPDAPWRLGLSAVIEQADGTASYWALAHPAGRPDFHHPDCFALELPAPLPP